MLIDVTSDFLAVRELTKAMLSRFGRLNIEAALGRAVYPVPYVPLMPDLHAPARTWDAWLENVTAWVGWTSVDAEENAAIVSQASRVRAFMGKDGPR